MKAYTRFLLFFFFISVITSCSSDESDIVGPTVDTRSDVEIIIQNSSNSSEKLEEQDGSLIYEWSDHINNTNVLIYTIHRKDDGAFVKMDVLTKTDLVLDKNNKMVITEKLEQGNYFISIIAGYGDYELDNNHLQLLKKSYDEAIFVSDPRQMTLFETKELHIESGEKKQESIGLKEMGSKLTYIFRIKNMKSTSKVKVDMNIKNLPTAFYLKNNKTITDKYYGNFSKSIEANNKNTPYIISQYFIINNMDIPDKNRGNFTVSYIVDDTESKNNTGAKSFDIPQSSISTNYLSGGYTYCYDLFNLENEQIDVVKKTTE